jgi:hypothetical protein
MAGTSPRHVPAVTDGGQNTPGPPDALNAPNTHNTDNTLEVSGEHGIKDSLGKKQAPSTTGSNHVEEDRGTIEAVHAVLNTVSSRLMSKAARNH